MSLKAFEHLKILICSKKGEMNEFCYRGFVEILTGKDEKQKDDENDG